MIRIFRFYESTSLENIERNFEEEVKEYKRNPEKFKRSHDYNSRYYEINGIHDATYCAGKHCLLHGDDNVWWFGIGSAYHYFGFMDGNGKYYCFDCSTREKTAAVRDKLQKWIDNGEITDDNGLFLAPDDVFEDI